MPARRISLLQITARGTMPPAPLGAMLARAPAASGRHRAARPAFGATLRHIPPPPDLQQGLKMAFSVILPGFRQKRARLLSVGGQLQGVKTGFGLYPVQRVPRQWGSDRKHPLFLSEVGKSRRRRQGCCRAGKITPPGSTGPPFCSRRSRQDAIYTRGRAINCKIIRIFA